MKVLLVSNSLTHYYNKVLSKLNNDIEIDLYVAAPESESLTVGSGVNQNIDDVNFKIIFFKEIMILNRIPYPAGLLGIVNNIKPDIVIIVKEYAMVLFFNFFLRVFLYRTNIKVILKSIPFKLDSYDKRLQDIFNISNYRSIFSGFRSFIRLLVDNYVFNIFDAHLNYIEASDLWKSYGVSEEKLFVTGNTPDTDDLIKVSNSISLNRSSSEFNSFRVIHVGRLVSWKDVDILILAIHHLKSRYPSIELYIVGEGPERSNLEALVSSLNLIGTVTFFGSVYDPRHLGYLFKKSAIYCLAGMGGLSINEAMCFELPVICSICDGTEKQLVIDGFNGYYFKSRDFIDLASKFETLFRNAELCESMGKNSLNIINNRININSVISIYKSAFDYVINQNKMV